MTITTNSNIQFEGIDESFPIAGQDNDTQILRDNFDTIKNSLRNAKTEIDELLDAAVRVDKENDLNLNTIQNCVLKNVREQKFDAGTPEPSNPTIVDFQDGHYHIYRLGADLNLEFTYFPGGPENPEIDPLGVGKATLELYSTSNTEARTVSFNTTDGAVIKSLGFPGFPNGGVPTITVDSTTDPLIIEVWRHTQEVIYLKYVGKFQ